MLHIYLYAYQNNVTPFLATHTQMLTFPLWVPVAMKPPQGLKSMVHDSTRWSRVKLVCYKKVTRRSRVKLCYKKVDGQGVLKFRSATVGEWWKKWSKDSIPSLQDLMTKFEMQKRKKQWKGEPARLREFEEIIMCSIAYIYFISHPHSRGLGSRIFSNDASWVLISRIWESNPDAARAEGKNGLLCTWRVVLPGMQQNWERLKIKWWTN